MISDIAYNYVENNYDENSIQVITYIRYQQQFLPIYTSGTLL